MFRRSPSPSPSSRRSHALLRGLPYMNQASNQVELFPVITNNKQRHPPTRAPPFHAIAPPSSTRTTSIRPDPSGLGDTFLDSNEAHIRETHRVNKEDKADKSLRTYRDNAPFEYGHTLPDLAFVHASPTRTSPRPNPSVVILGSRQTEVIRLVYENKDQAKKPFRTYHGRFSSGYDGAESNSFRFSPSEPMTSITSSSRQS